MKRKVCCRCGKLIGYGEKCKCSHYIPKSQKPIASEIDRILRTKRWSDKRWHIIKRDNGLCQRCLIKYSIFTYDNLQVHHIKPRIKRPDLIFEDSNLICLCKTCNLQLGIKEELDFEWQQQEESKVLL